MPLVAADTLADFEASLPRYLADLKTLVGFETPSCPSRLDRGAREECLRHLRAAAAWLEGRFALIGRVERIELPTGPLLKVTRRGRGPNVLLLAHYDTVHPRGSWKTLWREDAERIYGPGIYDMKGGLLFIPWAVRYLIGAGLEHPHLTILLTPDEEIGSEASREVIQQEATLADAALVLEAPTRTGDLKVARKGVGLFRVQVKGRAAHQGVEPEKGVNAVVEAAHFVLFAKAQEDLEAGTTVGPNVIRGGFASNVVAPEAELLVDLRAWTEAEARRVEAALAGYAPRTPGARVKVEGGLNRPPMEPTPDSMRLFEIAQEEARALGFEVGAGRVGGGSDGNFTQAKGVPTLDGLGPVGGGAHQPTEHVLKASLAPRGALLARLLSRLVDWR